MQKSDNNESRIAGLETLFYAIHLRDLSNRELMDEVFDKVYGDLRYTKECALWDECLERVEHEHEKREMRKELRRGIL